MCGMCGDVVDGCDQIECGALPKIREDGTRRARYVRWFTFDEDVWCKHLTEEYGTSSPQLADHIMSYHDWELEYDGREEYDPTECDDNCIEWGKWNAADIMAVVHKLREREN